MQQNSIGLYEVLPRRIAETVMGGDATDDEFDDLDEDELDEPEDDQYWDELDDDQEGDTLPPLPFNPQEDA